MNLFISTASVGGSKFPEIVGVRATGDNANSSSHSFAYPGNTTVAGELLIAIVCDSGNWQTPSGWTLLVDAGFSPKGTAFYKVASGSEGSSLTVSTTGGTSPAGGVIYRITKYKGIPEATITSGSGTSPNPPNLTVSWGIKKTLWVAADCSFLLFGSLSFSSYPSGFGDGVNAKGDTGSAIALIAAASVFDGTTDSYNPGTFGTSSSGTPSWSALTIGVRGQ